MLDPNTIHAVIISIIFVSLLALFANNKINNLVSNTDIQASNFFYKNLYHPVFKIVDFVQRTLLAVMFIVILIHPIFVEYPKKITYYICDTFIECVIPKDPEFMSFYDIPYPYNRKKFIKLNSYKLDYDGRRDMIKIESYFEEHPYSF